MEDGAGSPVDGRRILRSAWSILVTTGLTGFVFYQIASAALSDTLLALTGERTTAVIVGYGVSEDGDGHPTFGADFWFRDSAGNRIDVRIDESGFLPAALEQGETTVTYSNLWPEINRLDAVGPPASLIAAILTTAAALFVLGFWIRTVRDEVLKLLRPPTPPRYGEFL